MNDIQAEVEKLRRLAEIERELKGEKPFSLMDNIKNVGSAVYKGLAGTTAAAMDALAGSHDVTDIGSVFAGKPVRELDTTMPNSRALQASGYQPKTQGQRYINAGVQGATGAVLGPGAITPVRSLITGGAAGLGSEGAGQLPGVEGTVMEPYARVAGALAGGVAGGVATSTVGNAKKLAAEMFAGTNMSAVEKAKVLMAQARSSGLPVNLDQAMGEDTNITNLMKTLATQKEGQPVIDQLRAQPNLAEILAARIPKSLPGKVKETAKIANESQAAATDALKAARAQRTARTAPLFEQAGDAPPDLLDAMIRRVKAEADAAPDTNKGGLYSQLQSKLEAAKARATPTPSGLVDAQGNPIMSQVEPVPIQEINAMMRSQLTNAKNVNLSSSAGDREAIGGLQTLIGQLRDDMGAVSPKFKLANERYAKMSMEEVDPLKKGVVGRVAGISGELADKEAVNKLLPLLAKGRDPKAKTSEILEFAKATKKNPEVIQDAVKTHISKVIADADQRSNGVLNPAFAKDVEQGLFGTANQRQGMKDQLLAVAKSQGMRNPDLLYKGFKHAMQILGAAGKRPGSIGPDGGEFAEIAKQSTVAKGLSMIGLAPGKPLARGLEGMYTTSAYKTLAENLTTPEGVAKLQELAKLPLMGHKAQSLVSTLLATNAVKDIESDKPPEVRKVTPGHLTNEDMP